MLQNLQNIERTFKDRKAGRRDAMTEDKRRKGEKEETAIDRKD